jgi:hypothetical protein
VQQGAVDPLLMIEPESIAVMQQVADQIRNLVIQGGGVMGLAFYREILATAAPACRVE